MKNVTCMIIFLSAFLFIPGYTISQQKAAYQVPDTYNFDYEVVQQVKGSGKSPTTITYYYSQNGDYTALASDSKSNGLIINTKDGNTIIIDNQKKSMVIMRMQNMMGDIRKMAEQYKSNPSAASSPKHDSSDFKFAKTGNTKQVSGYTAEEYSYTDSKGQKGSVWYAKVDFNASLFFMFGAGASPAGAGMNKYAPSSASYPQFNDPHLLVTEMENGAHPGEGMTTQSISKKSLVITTKGYTVTNLSNMMGQ
jgi:hypothetical protein